jgi:hypothetical protein
MGGKPASYNPTGTKPAKLNRNHDTNMSTGHTVYPANIPWRALSVGLPAYAPSYNQHSSRAISEGWVLPPPQNNMAAKYIRMHLRCSSHCDYTPAKNIFLGNAIGISQQVITPEIALRYQR